MKHHKEGKTWKKQLLGIEPRTAGYDHQLLCHWAIDTIATACMTNICSADIYVYILLLLLLKVPMDIRTYSWGVDKC